MQDEQPSLRVQTVLYHNDTAELERAFDALVNSLVHVGTKLGRWIVVFGDSGTTPVYSEVETSRLSRCAAEAGGKFEYHFFGANLGHGGGHNQLHETSREDLLLILNPDGILAPDAIVRMLEAITPDTGILDARQLPMEHPKEYDAVTGDTSWSSLACALTPTDVFRKVGGIDHETFFMYCDDVDYSWRVRLAGMRARYCPQARMFHDKRLDRDGNFIAGETEKYYSAEAALMLAYKYSRDDIVLSLEEVMEVSDDPHLTRAVATFRSRRAADQLPERIDINHEVAEFIGGAYGAHRF